MRDQRGAESEHRDSMSRAGHDSMSAAGHDRTSGEEHAHE